MHPDTILEPPSCGRRLEAVAFLVRTGRFVLCERGAHARLQGRIDTKTSRHHHHEGHEALRRFERERGGHKLGGLQKTAPTFCLTVACGAGAACRWGPQGLVACMGRQEHATLLVHKGGPGRAGASAPVRVETSWAGWASWRGRPRMR